MPGLGVPKSIRINSSLVIFKQMSARDLSLVMSDYTLKSELMKFCLANDDAPGEPVTISDDLFRVLKHSKEIAELCDGAFDPTVGPLVKLWRTAKKTKKLASDDELLVNTDQDGSLKLRGSTNIPMFLAFFRTPKHHLSVDAFLDIDRTVKATNLDRHRVRLSCKLHDVLIEIVSEKDGYRMQKFR